MKTYELSPGKFDRVKSFYGKARIIEKDSGEKFLQSYNTEVCKITPEGKFIRLWDGYSLTTMRHINAFIELYNISGGGKSWWDSLEINV